MTDQQAAPAAHDQPAPGDDPTWARLLDQLGWYDSKSIQAQRAFKRSKLVQIVVSAAVPVLALADVPAVVTATAAAVVVVLEGLQQLNQWQTNWVQYRSTAEALKHERYLYEAKAGPYTGRDRHQVLAEKIEGLVSQEHAKWAETSRRAGVAADDQPPGESAG
jgi:hypothetical protein